MKRPALALALLVLGCGAEPETTPEPEAAENTSAEVDPALLRELLGESVQINAEQVRADGMLIRLAFDPLIRQTGSVSIQLVQGQGYRLSGIADGSPLWLLGLRDGDVLTGVDQQPIIGREHELRSRYESRPRRAELTFLRGTEAHTLRLDIANGSAWRSSPAIEPPPVSRIRPPVPEGSEPSGEELVDFAAGLRCVEGDPRTMIGRCEIERATLDKLLATPETMSRRARIVPALRDGEQRGFKFYGLRRSSLLSMMGIKNGDLLTHVDGIALTSLDDAMTAYGKLSQQTKFTVDFERKGAPISLEIEIVDALSGPAAGLSGSDEREVSPDLRDPFGDR